MELTVEDILAKIARRDMTDKKLIGTEGDKKLTRYVFD